MKIIILNLYLNKNCKRDNNNSIYYHYKSNNNIISNNRKYQLRQYENKENEKKINFHNNNINKNENDSFYIPMKANNIHNIEKVNTIFGIIKKE